MSSLNSLSISRRSFITAAAFTLGSALRYYCDSPEPYQQLTTYVYSDAAHKHLISTNIQNIPV